ncbi:hypothetical protein EYC84_008555 [Monilinia fructicola]|uniref:Dynamin N-terminal domain-containing protein n=1 Tax=Monilinia fructicola TaxID=38448 RepID=A0A5M9JJL7_MONFR|nr:hypothetical protein EYC84_008555 [Monilinia fructicola]
MRSPTRVSMAGKHIKHEAGSSRSPENESTSSIKIQMPAGRATAKEPSTRKSAAKKQIVKSLAALSSQNTVTKTTRPKSLWEGDLSEQPRVKVVKILEDAAEHGNTFIQAVYKEKRECQIHIGFLGGSGTGKSSVINALLGEENLLPVSDETASTAVIVEISYNNRDDSDFLYSALIEGVSESEIRRELEEFYEDMGKWKSGIEEEEGEPDTEILQRMQDTASKYKTNVQLLMDKRRIIEADDLKEFATAIKPYIDTSKKKDGGVSHSLWPLVKVVKIFTKAAILKAGIVFVDLPGVHDTSAARNAIARNHLKNLNISCVVSPSGLFTAESLFFVVSKIDESLSVERYLSDHPDLGLKLQDDIHRIKETEARLEAIEQVLKVLASKRDKGIKKIAKLNRAIKSNFNGQVVAGQKRKRDDENDSVSPETTLSQAQNARSNFQMEVNSQSNKLWTLQTKKQSSETDLANTRCRLKSECIKNRNEIQIAAITEEFEVAGKKLEKRTLQKPLQIFCLSAQAFMNLCTGQPSKALESGFFTRDDTGIPKFRDALIATIWEPRLRNAHGADERAIVDAKLDEMCRALEQEFEELNFDTSYAIEKLVADQLYPQFEDIAMKAYEEERKLVLRSWVQKQSPGILTSNQQEIWKFAGLSLSAADDISASFRDSLENIKDSVLAHRRRLKQGASVVFADFDTSTKDIWRLIKTECEETWQEIYQSCGDETGTGTYERNKASHKAHLKGDGGLAILEIIKQQFIDVLGQHTALGTRHNQRRVHSKLKINLRHALEPHFDQLYKAWQAEPEVESQNQQVPISDEPSDSEISDDLDELLRVGAQDQMDIAGPASDVEEGDHF